MIHVIWFVQVLGCCAYGCANVTSLWVDFKEYIASDAYGNTLNTENTLYQRLNLQQPEDLFRCRSKVQTTLDIL